MKTFSTFLDLVNIYLQAGVVRGRFYWALLWNTYIHMLPEIQSLPHLKHKDKPISTVCETDSPKKQMNILSGKGQNCAPQS